MTSNISESDLARYVANEFVREVDAYELEVKNSAIRYGLGTIACERKFIAEQIRLGRASYEAALYLRIKCLETEILTFIQASAHLGEPSKIQGIKLLRAIHGWGLKESKDAYEKMVADGEEERAKIAEVRRRVSDVPSFEEAITTAIRNLHNRVSALENGRVL